jgi:NAD(P)-dependent dehydrogenase (short-subunit alcohol dehydrogenase family)
MQALKDKVAIVTGASSGIGRATARLFAREGAKLVIGARRDHALREVVAAIEADGGSAIGVIGDIRDEAHACALVDAAVERFGGLDIAFNNAGTLGASGPTHALPTSGWRETLDCNLSGAFYGARAQIAAMRARGGGSLIFTSTFVGHTVGFGGYAAYAASKAGLIGLTQALAAEYGAEGIRVNAILPGGTDTPMAQAMTGTPEVLAAVRRMHALGRIATPEEMAQSVLYLASPAASFTTGTALLVDGGISIFRG